MPKVLPEILSHIFHLSAQASPCDRNHDHYSTQLANLALVSKEWGAVAQPLLYRSPILAMSSEEKNWKLLFLKTLQDAPELASMVRVLKLEGWECHTRPDPLLAILTACLNLAELNAPFCGEHILSILAAAPSLTSVKLGVSSNEFYLLPLPLQLKGSHAVMLETLAVADVAFLRLHDQAKALTLPHLRHFSLHTPYGMGMDVVLSKGAAAETASSTFTGDPWVNLLSHHSSIVQMALKIPQEVHWCGTCRPPPFDYLLDRFSECRVNSLHFYDVWSASSVTEVLDRKLAALSQLKSVSITWRDYGTVGSLTEEEEKWWLDILREIGEKCQELGSRFDGEQAYSAPMVEAL